MKLYTGDGQTPVLDCHDETITRSGCDLQAFWKLIFRDYQGVISSSTERIGQVFKKAPLSMSDGGSSAMNGFRCTGDGRTKYFTNALMSQTYAQNGDCR